MKHSYRSILFLLLSALLMASCSSVKHLPAGQVMLVKNDVKVVDAKNPDFDNLKSYVRPPTNKKLLDLIRIKTVFYDWGQPTYGKDGKTKDSKFRKFLREKMGEAPVVLDSNDISTSLDQLKIVMKQLGYFDATMDYSVKFKGKDEKKAQVTYFVTANQPYFISNIDYDITIPEYKRIVVINQHGTLLSEGMQYNEALITDELTRIINLIRNEGYYYVEKSIIRCNVSYDPPDSLGNDPHTVSLTILMNIPQNENASRYLYKYYFNDNYVNTDLQYVSDQIFEHDTAFYVWKYRNDSANFYFNGIIYKGKPTHQYFSYRTLSDAIFTRTGHVYTQMTRNQSSRALRSLDNFEYTNISFIENEALLDTVNRKGYLDVVYRLVRKKQHSIGGQLELRNDKSDISISYTNRNLFKGAEHLTINISGGYFYYSLTNLFKRDLTYSYPEFGISATLNMPNRLFLFNRHLDENSISRSTSINVGVNYSGLYRRLMYNAGLTYRWTHSSFISYSFSPIDVSTINNSDKRFARLINYDNYPESYQNRFGKFFLLSSKFSLNYLVPKLMDTRRHNMNLSINLESCGLLLKGLNMAFSPNERWVLSQNNLDSVGYNYTTFEKMDVIWNYTYSINKENAVAMRAEMGAIIPLDKDSQIPYEKGFYLGTSNSMRGWSYRGLGPGSYQRGVDSLYTGDIKIELNLEYRGTIYHSFKYGLFVDAGNIWLSRKTEDMPGADFSFERFYKELAVDVGVGLRLDFDFFVIRVDWAVPIYDPTRNDSQGRVINKKWFSNPHRLRFVNGLKIAIGYAF